MMLFINNLLLLTEEARIYRLTLRHIAAACRHNRKCIDMFFIAFKVNRKNFTTASTFIIAILPSKLMEGNLI